jgi:uncharacterized protein (DUF697 family)
MKRDAKTSPEAAAANAEAEAVAAATAEEMAPSPMPVEADAGISDTASRAEAARTRAAQFMAERRYADARKALEEADTIEEPAAEPVPASGKKLPHRVLTAVRSQLRRPRRTAPTAENGHTAADSAPDRVAAPTPPRTLGPDERSIAIVNLYAKIAGVVGLVPGGLLNFAAILAVQVTMVWRISNTFGHREGKERIRGLILSLLGSAVPTGIGGGMALAVASIPAVVTGTVLGFVVTPVLAYAMTKAVGGVFIMHFESGGTLLTFDPKAFREYFIKEFRAAGGMLKTDKEQ